MPRTFRRTGSVELIVENGCRELIVENGCREFLVLRVCGELIVEKADGELFVEYYDEPNEEFVYRINFEILESRKCKINF